VLGPQAVGISVRLTTKYLGEADSLTRQGSPATGFLDESCVIFFWDRERNPLVFDLAHCVTV